jgi:hypothetical protein
MNKVEILEIVTPFNRREKAITEACKKIEKDKLLLKKSGVTSLFEKINKNDLENRASIYFRNAKYPTYSGEIDNRNPVSISLEFNNYETGSNDDIQYHSSEVRIAVIDDKLNLVEYNRENFKYNYTAIKDGKLEETVAKAIQNPMIW